MKKTCLLFTWDKNVLNKKYVSWGLHIVCFKTFSVKRQWNNLHRKYMFFGGPCGKCIFSYNFTDRTKFMILLHLQRLGTECKVSQFLNFWKIKCRKRFDFFSQNFTLSYNCLFVFVFSLERDGNRKMYNVAV